MKSVTVKVITISSQLLLMLLFLFFIFFGKGNDKSLIVDNVNFDKMADKTSILFKDEEIVVATTSSDIVVPLEEEDVLIVDEEKVIQEESSTDDLKEEIVLEESNTLDDNLFYDRSVIKTEIGTLTGYGADCHGCTGITKSGYNLNESIYYNDSEFGSIRILAADGSFGVNAIFRVSGVPGMDPFIAIVLDTGGNVGYGKGTLFDLAYATESDPNLIGKTSNVKFELLREGTPWKW